MAKISMYGKDNVNNLANMLSSEIQNSAMSCSLIDSVMRTVGDVFVYVMVFEKYYMRSSNRASLTVTVIGDSENVTVDAIGAGGGQGAFFKFSWGAEENFVGTVEKILSRQGFQYF